MKDRLIKNRPRIVVALLALLLLIGSWNQIPVFAQDEPVTDGDSDAEETSGEDPGNESDDEGTDYEDVDLDLGTLYVEDTHFETEEILDRPTAFATVLDPQVLSRRSISLPEALDTVPGVSVRSFGGLGALSTISIRGMGSENVLVILDGVPLNPSGGSIDLSDIPLGSLERIEIIRGGEGAIYGGGSAGGVIRLESVRAGDDSEPTRSGRISAGSFGTYTGGFTWFDPGDIFHLEFASSEGDFQFLNNNGTGFDTSDDFNDTRTNNDFTMLEVRYSHAFDLENSRSLGLSFECFKADKGIPGIITFPTTQASQTDDRLFLHSLYTDPGFQDGEFITSVSSLRQTRGFSDPLGESTGVPLFTSWSHDRFEFKTQWTGIGLGQGDIMTLGTSYSHESLGADEYNDPTRNTLSTWIRDEWYMPSDAVIIAAIRNDWIDSDPTFSPEIGLKYPLNESWIARTNFGLDFRPPSFEELYRNEGLVVGNTDLVPERTLNFDIGLTHTSNDLRFEVAYFNLQTRDLIDYLLISGYRWKPYNIGRARSSGFELSTHWAISPTWELRGNYSRTRAIDTSDDPTTQGQPLVGQPASDLFTELHWQQHPWEFYTNWHRRGSSPITPSGTRFLTPDNSVGMGIGYTFPDDLSLLLEVKNLFDEDLSDVRGFPLPGQSWFLTLTRDW